MKNIKDILEKEDNRDYSDYIKNSSQIVDERPFLTRLVSSIKTSVSFSAKNIPDSIEDVKKGIKINISGGTDF